MQVLVTLNNAVLQGYAAKCVQREEDPAGLRFLASVNSLQHLLHGLSGSLAYYAYSLSPRVSHKTESFKHGSHFIHLNRGAT